MCVVCTGGMAVNPHYAFTAKLGQSVCLVCVSVQTHFSFIRAKNNTTYLMSNADHVICVNFTIHTYACKSYGVTYSILQQYCSGYSIQLFDVRALKYIGEL